MVASVESLKNRYLKVIGDKSNGVIYSLNQVTEATLQEYSGQELYKTPDACLQAIYEDAHAHHFQQIKVGMFAIFYETDQNDVIGYAYKMSRGTLTTRDLEDVSFMWILENGFGGGERVKLNYPKPKPELEILNYLWFNADQWCKSNKYADLESFNEHRREKWMNENRPYKFTDEEVLILRRQYAELGYDVSHLDEAEYVDGGELYITKEEADATRS